MTYRVRNIVVAVVLAALAGALTIVYVVNYKRHVRQDETKVNVLISARDIPAGTTGSEVVEQHMYKTESVARRTLVPGSISDTDQIQRLVATQEIFAGEQVTTRRFAPPREQGIRSLLRATERGIQISGDPNQVLAGTLKDGDYVDIVGTWNEQSRVIVRNSLVLKAPDAVEGAKVTAGEQQASVQLRVTDIQAQKLKYILEEGDSDQSGRTWHLLLRPPVRSADSANTFQNGHSMLSDGPGVRWGR